jgi:hypothetical protein
LHAATWNAAHDVGVFIETGIINPLMHLATLDSKNPPSAHNWEHLSDINNTAKQS